MKSITVLISTALTICYGMSVSLEEDKTQISENRNTKSEHVTELGSDDSVINILPLKILLEYKLKIEDDLRSENQFTPEENSKTDFSQKKLKTGSVTPREENLSSRFCNETNLLETLSSSEMSTVINNKENLLTKEQLQKIYESIKDCFYVKSVNAKLWGPLWHCLNRLFLFFVFN